MQTSILSSWACCLQMLYTGKQIKKINIFYLVLLVGIYHIIEPDGSLQSALLLIWMLLLMNALYFWEKKILYLSRVWLSELICRIIVIATTTGDWNQTLLSLWVMHNLWFIFRPVKGLGLMNVLGFYAAVEFQCFKSQYPQFWGREMRTQILPE